MPPTPDREACTYCREEQFLTTFCGHRVCGRAYCLNRARDDEVTDQPVDSEA